MASEKIKAFFTLALEKCTVLQNVNVAIIVGTILNLINQSSPLMHFNFANINLSKFALTYCVPYLVSTYSASTTKMIFTTGHLANLDATLRCKTCETSRVEVQKGEIVPPCTECGNKTRWTLLKLHKTSEAQHS